MQEEIKRLEKEAQEAIGSAKDTGALEAIRVKYFGKKGVLTALLRSMGALPTGERPKVGQMVNETSQRLEGLLENRLAIFQKAEKQQRLAEEAIDITIPAREMRLGRLHPLTLVYQTTRDIFLGMGFEVREGPEVEWEKYNFEMLNIPENHPSRDMQDTFYITDKILLRTHTSPVQVRTMLAQKPPIRMICPGRVYRVDEVDATHSPMFHQIEGLVVDKGITMGDLKGVLDVFAKALFGPATRTRFRASYFPFTEPSAEMDVSCSVCGGEGCRVCKGTGFIEIMGAGMVHTSVLQGCGIDPRVYSGFAFGMGLDRMANMKYGIADIRLLYENDIRFLEQF
ncbi:MAG: phenylalanine--tRNA ligase subunit alpha [Bacillota bacterium]|nr:phenylalanine--tRNA ligase subunit alpha [Bacillota bacterium]